MLSIANLLIEREAIHVLTVRFHGHPRVIVHFTKINKFNSFMAVDRSDGLT